MTAEYTVIGSEESPYSVKVRSYFRYKGIPHEWRDRGQAADLYARHARLPLIPLVVTPDDTGIQDSTPIIEAMEAKFPEPSIHPPGGVAAFVSVLLEEFGDEWGNKWMFHMRWAREIDQVTVSRRFAANRAADEIDAAAQAIRERMVPRVWFVGSNDVTAPQIEQSFADVLPLLDAHLASRPYLFGARPSFGDFGLWGQIYEAGRDPTAGALVAGVSNVVAWIDRMLDPENLGGFEDWGALEPTLMPILSDQVAGIFLPWDVANAKAIADGADEFDVTLKGNRWTQKPQKYHARSLGMLKAKYAAAAGDAALDEVLTVSGCKQYLAG
ncbi:MAG: glutathione S-transferase family protein [Gammaproteobacteria bacterium]|nr:glutathione S-transferase family protein [Gammaproteobacteria bacterium]